MILSDQTIKEMIDLDTLQVSPLQEESIQSSSLDCHLGSHYLVIEDRNMTAIDMNSEIIYRTIEDKKITIPPHSFLLATTEEYIKLPNHLTAFVEGRSSIGRMGLFIQNAGWVDPGFEGRITLELYNANSLPILLESGRRICQLVFCQMDKPSLHPYRGKYQGQSVTTGSRAFEDRESSYKQKKASQ